MLQTAPAAGSPASTTLTRLQELVAELTFVEPEEVMPTMRLDELNEEDWPMIVKRLNQEFDIHLNAIEVKSRIENEELETVKDLSYYIEDEQELG